MKRGETSHGKGDKNRLQPNEFAAWDNSQLWANIDAKKLENKIKDKAIKILRDEEDSADWGWSGQ